MACAPNTAHASPSPSRSPLLRLTPDIRLRLYRYLGLATWDGSPYRFDLRGGRASRTYMGCPPDPIDFHGLLISCRSIYAEAAALLYSTNNFVVHYHASAQLRGFHSLGVLTEASLRSLSQLKIVVNEAACHDRLTENDGCCCQGRDEDDSTWSDSMRCRKKHCGIHQAPLLSDSGATSADDDARHAWLSAAARLFSCIAPGRLALSLIRLAKTPYWPLQQLARDAVVHACGLPTPVSESLAAGATATLTSLPREVRIRILEYTDLVAPRRQVIWSRQDRAYMILRFRRVGDPPPNPDEAHAEQFFECYRGRAEGCFCRRRHAAFALHCRCWAPPGATLFLVCRTLSQEAQYVFFSHNRFIVHDYNAYVFWRPPSPQPGPEHSPQRGSYPFDRFVASEFLCDVVPASALGHLRFLELVFPPYLPGTWPGPEHPAARDWTFAVCWLCDMLNLPALTLRVVVVDESNGASDRARGATVEEASVLLRAYTQFLVPLRSLVVTEPAGLTRFYAHFQYPWQRAPWDRARGELPRRGPWYDPWFHKRDLKERLERYVLGEQYESLYADGREEPWPSDWDYMYFADRPW